MKQIKTFYKPFFMPSLWLIIMIVSSYFGILFIQKTMGEPSMLFDDLVKQLQQLDIQLDEANLQKSIYKEYNQRFSYLLSNKISKKINPVRMAQSLELIQSSLNIKELKYNISTIKKINEFNGIDLKAITVILDIGLLHEMVLIDVFSTLNRIPGQFATKSCEINRASETILPKQMNFKAHCILEWYIIDL
jgi:archaellum component FlaC